MGSLSRMARIAVTAGSAAFIGFETSVMQSGKAVTNASDVVQGREASDQESRAAQEVREAAAELRRKQTKAAERRRCAPKMAPQFDGLNFYETYIGASQR